MREFEIRISGPMEPVIIHVALDLEHTFEDMILVQVAGADLIGIDLLPLGDERSITVGWWPDGENWERLLTMPLKELIEDRQVDGSCKSWVWEWTSGGYNTCLADSYDEALKKACSMSSKLIPSNVRQDPGGRIASAHGTRIGGLTQ